MIQEHRLQVPRTARYFVLGETARPGEVWFVCHGYGHLAQYFIRHFESLASGTRLIVAPEALARFYLDNPDGGRANARVGASWMTREDRLAEIEDYVTYLNTLYRTVLGSTDAPGARVVALGFSQGVATACRWIARGVVRADRLILWAGAPPPDLDLTAAAPVLRMLDLVMVVGAQDRLMDAAAFAEQEQRLAQHDIPYRLVRFEGGHDLDAGVLAALAG